MDGYNFDTLAVHAGYEAEKTTKAVAVPIYQTAAYKFDSTEFARSIFELAEEGSMPSPSRAATAAASMTAAV